MYALRVISMVQVKIKMFVQRLRTSIAKEVMVHALTTYSEALSKAIWVEIMLERID